ncbi:aminopeptidase [Herminiimonas sp. CN]|uniref:aminopeptidase n=1 Tax=Herminiimonas sp. CN TaxID=1349818 RepID=UPI00047314A7|nr:aminopeptidase [Herminiimonas sp. CN]
MAVLLALSGLLGGCAQLGYLVQAAHGQSALLSAARPIDDWLADPQADPGLKDKLATAKLIRAFAVRELALPDNASYTTYAALRRPFVLWNVVATPALSLKPKQWCFPVAGCVSYRGYYELAQARAEALALRTEGYDVQVAGVPAYSTLGWFKDPVISTFIHYPDAELARLIFHELAHQVAYAPGDSEFNESFATTVEQAGLQRWLDVHGDAKMRQSYAVYAARKQGFLGLLLHCRQALEANYAAATPEAEKLRRKAEIFQALQQDYQALKQSWGGYTGYDRWFAEPLSNAHLAALATYHDLVPAFQALLRQDQGFERFYADVKALANLERQQRRRRLLEFAGTQTLRDLAL